MRQITHYIELLDRAALELDAALPVNNSLALILTDNVVELLCHHACEDKFTFDKLFLGLLGNKYTKVLKRQVLGDKLDAKLQFLKAESLLNEEEHSFITICHKYRNEAYHVGLTHTSINYQLAWEYHAFACMLLARFDNGARHASSDDKLTLVLAKHYPPADGGPDTGFVFLYADIQAITNSIQRQKPPINVTLSQALAEDRLAVIDETEEAWEFILRNDPNQRNADEQLRDVQWWNNLFADIPIHIEEGTEEYRQCITDRRQAMLKRWRAKHKKIPFDAWRKRAKSLRKYSAMSALARYETLKGDMRYLCEAITESASSLDQAIDQEIDRMRGK